MCGPNECHRRECIENDLERMLPNDLFDSKDWRKSGLIGKVEWLLAMYQSKCRELDHAYNMLENENA